MTASHDHIEPMHKGAMMARLGIKSYPTLKKLVTSHGIPWIKGYQIFTAAEVAKIFHVYDHNLKSHD